VWWNILQIWIYLRVNVIDNSLIQNLPAVKKSVWPQKEGQCEKRCEIQGGSQEMA